MEKLLSTKRHWPIRRPGSDPPHARRQYLLNRPRRVGFTLIELLVVILIIGIISAVALPTILPALGNREMSEAGRLLQGALVGARDKAIHDGQPCGIRLLPDPAFPITYVNGQINPFSILAYNRVVPIDSAPEYSEGMVSVNPQRAVSGVTGAYTAAIFNPLGANTTVPSLILEQAPVQTKGGLTFPNAPTSWFWNIRVGDKVQVGGAGPWYTVAGPMWIGPSQGNTELFVNIGDAVPNTNLLTDLTGNFAIEWLVLVNGRDDGTFTSSGPAPTPDGWIDSGWDGVDNDGDGVPDNPAEWEAETWHGGPTWTQTSVPYTIRRRPAPSAAARELALPTSVVIDATSSFVDRERSRLPVNQWNGIVDIVLNPDGTLLPTTIYGAPSSFGMDQAFLHFWLADRQDLVDIQANLTAQPPTPIPLNTTTPSYYLPLAQPGVDTAAQYPGPYLKGNYSILTLFARTGQIAVNANPPFFYDSTIGYNNQTGAYHPYNPFIPAELGTSGGP